MHGKQFLLDKVYAGIDESKLYGRVDFVVLTEEEFELRVNLDCAPPDRHCRRPFPEPGGGG